MKKKTTSKWQKELKIESKLNKSDWNSNENKEDVQRRKSMALRTEEARAKS